VDSKPIPIHETTAVHGMGEAHAVILMTFHPTLQKAGDRSESIQIARKACSHEH